MRGDVVLVVLVVVLTEYFVLEGKREEGGRVLKANTYALAKIVHGAVFSCSK